jgi:hypothetical protein
VQITKNLRIYGGYNLLYWSTLIRPGEQVSSLVDPRQVPTDQAYMQHFVGTAPFRSFNRNDFFAHGFGIGLEVGY